MARRRMTKHLSLVLLSSLSSISGCGCNGRTQEMVEVEEWVQEPPPDGVETVIGSPFLLWWAEVNPPKLEKHLVPKDVAAANSGTRSSYHRPYYSRPYYGGRTSYLSSAFSSGSHSSSSISRGGFGSTGHSFGGSSS